jgi:hypothetical protein
VRALLVLTVVVLAGCGGSSTENGPTATTPRGPAAAIGGRTLYRGGDWAVVVKDEIAVALRLVAGTWTPDRTGRVRVEILGPHATAPAVPQVAAQLTAKTSLVESGLWVDGQELVAKGGGLTPTKGTIYGAPGAPLAKGPHLAVAYARTATAATAVARAFTVR